jgi:hypothetical protein
MEQAESAARQQIHVHKMTALQNPAHQMYAHIQTDPHAMQQNVLQAFTASRPEVPARGYTKTAKHYATMA